MNLTLNLWINRDSESIIDSIYKNENYFSIEFDLLLPINYLKVIIKIIYMLFIYFDLCDINKILIVVFGRYWEQAHYSNSRIKSLWKFKKLMILISDIEISYFIKNIIYIFNNCIKMIIRHNS